MIGKVKLRRLALPAVAVALLVGPALWAQPRQRPVRPSRPGGPQLRVGQDAPDVELAPLVFAKDANGQMMGTIGKKPVKLSDFKGKAPICIFSSSYT